MSTHGHRCGQSETPTYCSYRSMIARVKRSGCNGHRYYSGIREVKIDPRWLGAGGFANFLADLGERPPGTTLGRVNPFGDYCPGNVEYQTPKKQAAGHRTTAPIEMMGRKTTMKELVSAGVPTETVIFIQRSRYKSRQQRANG
jgi:hypothetical protein